MSVEAISWALNLAPVPAGRGGQPSTAGKFVLVGLANHAGPDGMAALRRPRSVNEIAGQFDLTQQAISLHLKGGLRRARPAGDRVEFQPRRLGLRAPDRTERAPGFIAKAELSARTLAAVLGGAGS